MGDRVIRGSQRPRWRRYLFWGVVGLSSLLAACSGSPSTLDPHGADAAQTASLSWLMFAVAAIVFVIVTLLLLIAIIRSRRNEIVADPYLHDRQALILVLISGGVVPVVVLLILMALGVVIESANAAPESTRVTVEVIGHRWWWEVHYPDLNITTANEIHIPANETVLIRTTSADVIHSLWIPQLHGKIDLIPGQTNTISLDAAQPGVYRGQCAEFCGAQHAHMAFLVVADKADDFNKWVANQQKAAPDPSSSDPLTLEGQQAFLGSSCVYCHTIKGTNASGTLGPDLTHLASRRTIGAGLLPNTPGNLAGWIINSQAVKPGNLMPPMDLDSDQLQAVLAYLATLQ